MKTSTRLVVAAVAAALALTSAAFAAKGDRKEKPAGEARGLAKIDTDKNGSVSESEFVAAMKAKGGEEAAKTRFASLDKNSDGKLDKKELAGAKNDTEGKKPGRRKKNQE